MTDPAYVEQVVWQSVTITTSDAPVTYYRGELLPATADAGELAQRATLRAGGATRTVYAVYSTQDYGSAITARVAAALTAQTAAYIGYGEDAAPATQGDDNRAVTTYGAISAPGSPDPPIVNATVAE